MDGRLHCDQFQQTIPSPTIQYELRANKQDNASPIWDLYCTIQYLGDHAVVVRVVILPGLSLRDKMLRSATPKGWLLKVETDGQWLILTAPNLGVGVAMHFHLQ